MAQLSTCYPFANPSFSPTPRRFLCGNYYRCLIVTTLANLSLADMSHVEFSSVLYWLADFRAKRDSRLESLSLSCIAVEQTLDFYMITCPNVKNLTLGGRRSIASILKTLLQCDRNMKRSGDKPIVASS